MCVCFSQPSKLLPKDIQSTWDFPKGRTCSFLCLPNNYSCLDSHCLVIWSSMFPTDWPRFILLCTTLWRDWGTTYVAGIAPTTVHQRLLSLSEVATQNHDSWYHCTRNDATTERAHWAWVNSELTKTSSVGVVLGCWDPNWMNFKWIYVWGIFTYSTNTVVGSTLVSFRLYCKNRSGSAMVYWVDNQTPRPWN